MLIWPTGSDEERLAVQRASLHSSRHATLAASIYQDAVREIKFTFDGEMSPNGNVKLELTITNSSEETRNIEVRMHALAQYYTGLPGEEVGEHKDKVTLEAQGGELSP